MFMEKNVLVLAYLGDSIYEFFIREALIKRNIAKVNDLQKEAISYVSATSQAKFLKNMIDNKFLTSDEESIVYRARNHKSNHKPKYSSMVTYKNATGIEALIGYLYYENKIERIKEIMNYILESDFN